MSFWFSLDAKQMQMVIPVWPLALAMCSKPLPLEGSTVAARIVEELVERFLARTSMLVFKSEVSPMRERYSRSSISSSEIVGGVAVGILRKVKMK